MAELSKEAKGLIKLRKQNHLTQKELSHKTEKDGKIMVSQAHISKIENGQRSPTTETIMKILEPFNISYVDFLLDYCGYKRTNTIGINNGLAIKEEIERIKALNNENDPTQQIFTNFVDISEVKGFEFDGEPLNEKEQTALFSIIDLIKSYKD